MTKHSKSLPQAEPATTGATTTTAKKRKSEQPGAGHAPTPAGRFTIGLDLGDRSTAFCVLDTDAAIVSEGKLKTTQAAIDHQFASLLPARVALEAATHSGLISRLIEAHGYEVIVTNPRKVRKMRKMRKIQVTIKEVDSEPFGIGGFSITEYFRHDAMLERRTSA
jgi:hypothetical protein